MIMGHLDFYKRPFEYWKELLRVRDAEYHKLISDPELTFLVSKNYQGKLFLSKGKAPEKSLFSLLVASEVLILQNTWFCIRGTFLQSWHVTIVTNETNPACP